MLGTPLLHGEWWKHDWLDLYIYIYMVYPIIHGIYTICVYILYGRYMYVYILSISNIYGII